MIKLNNILEKSKKDDVEAFIELLKRNVEDSCVFIRQIILSLYKFPEEQTKRLKTILSFYNQYKFTFEKIIIEYLKVPRLCDESKSFICITPPPHGIHKCYVPPCVITA